MRIPVTVVAGFIGSNLVDAAWPRVTTWRWWDDLSAGAPDPHGEAGVVAIFIQRLLAGLTPVIYGDGEQVRDFVSVEDFVRANLAAHAIAVPPGEPVVVNIDTGRGTSLNVLWQALAAVVRPSVGPYHEPETAAA